VLFISNFKKMYRMVLRLLVRDIQIHWCDDNISLFFLLNEGNELKEIILY
jgi:hypothetical protein